MSENNEEQVDRSVVVNEINETEEIGENGGEIESDAIGNTAYSQRFVIKTLLGLQDLNWTTEYEDTLCVLWDMSIESDVSDLLNELDYLTIVPSTIQNYSENNRLIEILIGIIGNMLTNYKIVSNIGQQYLNTILGFLTSNDAATLEQIFRCINLIIYYHPEFQNTFQENEIFVSRIIEIFTNSLVPGLLLQIIDALTALYEQWETHLDTANILTKPGLFDGFVECLENFQDLITSDTIESRMKVFGLLVHFVTHIKETNKPESVENFLNGLIRSYSNDRLLFHDYMEENVLYEGVLFVLKSLMITNDELIRNVLNLDDDLRLEPFNRRRGKIIIHLIREMLAKKTQGELVARYGYGIEYFDSLIASLDRPI